jgi:hypothetical protein
VDVAKVGCEDKTRFYCAARLVGDEMGCVKARSESLRRVAKAGGQKTVSEEQ